MEFLICVALQIILFIPSFFIWMKDCKAIGKENLVVSLKERFITWIIFCPIWIVPFFR